MTTQRKMLSISSALGWLDREPSPMRNISFALTTQQILDQQKDVTRRLGWLFL